MSAMARRRKAARFQVEIVTPCFVGGADRKTAEWRSSSIRGQIRWWLRAIVPGDLARVRAVEEQIFGSTSQPSAVTILALESPQPTSQRECSWGGRGLTAEELAAAWNDSTPVTIQRLRLNSRTSNPIHYLGYGPILWQNKRVEITRAFLPPNSKCALEIRWARLDQQCERWLLIAIAAWFHLGGIGARSRRGFGSLRCTKADIPSDTDIGFETNSLDEFKLRVRSLFSDRGTSAEAWSRFGPGTRICAALKSFVTWEDALSAAGSWMIAFRRRYGSPADTGRLKGPGLDYRWAAEGGSRRREGFPDRSGFGLPLQFGRGRDAETIVWGDARHDRRRASPLLIHIAKVANIGFFPVLTHFPAPLIPTGEKLFFKGAGPQPTGSVFGGVVRTFLDDLEARKLVEAIA